MDSRQITEQKAKENIDSLNKDLDELKKIPDTEKTSSDHDKIATCYNSLGVCYDILKCHEQALEYFKASLAELLEIYRTPNANSATFKSLIDEFQNCYLTNIDLQRFDNAAEVLERALTILPLYRSNQDLIHFTKFIKDTLDNVRVLSKENKIAPDYSLRVLNRILCLSHLLDHYDDLRVTAQIHIEMAKQYNRLSSQAFSESKAYRTAIESYKKLGDRITDFDKRDLALCFYNLSLLSFNMDENASYLRESIEWNKGISKPTTLDKKNLAQALMELSNLKNNPPELLPEVIKAIDACPLPQEKSLGECRNSRSLAEWRSSVGEKYEAQKLLFAIQMKVTQLQGLLGKRGFFASDDQEKPAAKTRRIEVPTPSNTI